MEHIFLVCFYLFGSAACLLQGIYEFFQHRRYTRKAKQKGKKFGKIFVSIGLIFVCLCFAGVAFSLSYLFIQIDLVYFGYSCIFLAIILSFCSLEASKHYVVHAPEKKEKTNK